MTIRYWLLMSHTFYLLGFVLLLAAPAIDLEKLARFAPFWADAAYPEGARSDVERQRALQKALDEARAAFGGKGPDVAEYFLRHTDYRAPNEAYWFVLEAVGDLETARRLIDALPAPPPVEAGVLPRDHAEIRIAIEGLLRNEQLQREPAIVRNLVDVVRRDTARYSEGTGAAATAIFLLGRCRGPDATSALQKLTTVSNATLRSLAAEALGESSLVSESGAKSEGMAKSESGVTVEATIATLASVLQSDPALEARVRAAQALAKLGKAEGVDPLRTALAKESDAQVVDAIVTALETLGAPIVDPEECFKVAERCWEPQAASPCFARWRARASSAAVVEAATTAKPVVRILALHSLMERPDAPESLLKFGWARASPPMHFDAATQARLLRSIVELLSWDRAMSGSIRGMAHEALWGFSGQNMVTALQHADRVSPKLTRFDVSNFLSRQNASQYAAYRRPRQALMALWLAIPVSALLAYKRWRLPAALVLVSIIMWAIWSLVGTGVRDLPPPPFAFLTISCLALLSGGLTSAGLRLISSLDLRWWPSSGVIRAALAPFIAGGVALIICAWTRSTRAFPVGGEGWELLFDPLIASMLAAIWAFLLSSGEAIFFRLRQN